MNLGNVREEVLFVTDYDFNLVEIDSTEVEVIEDEINNHEIPDDLIF